MRTIQAFKKLAAYQSLHLNFKKLEKYFNQGAQKIISEEGDVFNFPGLKMTEQTEESIAILNVKSPKIVIAGSGMSNGGRIIHHEKNYLDDVNVS